jgi:hypothetical protein
MFVLSGASQQASVVETLSFDYGADKHSPSAQDEAKEYYVPTSQITRDRG